MVKTKKGLQRSSDYYQNVVETHKGIYDILTPKWTKYIPYTPTIKQQVFLLSQTKECFYGGAGHPLDTDIMTPFGIRKMGDLKVGQRVCHPNGTSSAIIDIIPLGQSDIYEFTFSDGVKTKVTSDHIWKYSVAGKGAWRKSGLHWKLATTLQLIEMQEEGREILIPLTKPVQITKSYRHDHRQIHPYVLGVLLGDGSIGGKSVSFSSIDSEIVEKMQCLTGTEWYNHGISYRIRGEEAKNLIYWLKKNKLMGTKSDTKFIPQQYKYSTIEQRLELLKGLMDTDGTATPDGKIYYCSVSKQLAQDMQWLVRSLGGRATITTATGQYRNKEGVIVKCKLAYTLYIRFPDNSIAFYLPRKKQRAVLYNAGRFELKTKIKSIVKLEKKENAQCIKVDNPDGLYLANDFIVTHNCGGAKSVALLMAALQYVDCPDYAAIILRDTFSNLSMPNSLMDVADDWLGGTDAKWHDHTKTWEFPSGATLSFGYLHGPRDHLNYKGAEFQFIGIDEASDLRWKQIMYMFSRLRKKDSSLIPLRFRITSNPGGISHEELKKRYIDKETRKPGVMFIPAKLQDNPHLDQDTYIDSLMNLDPIERQRLLEGDWEVREQGTMFNREWFKVIKNINEDEIEEEIRYWDLAATEQRKEGHEPCYTAGVRIARTIHNQYIIRSVIRFRKPPRYVEQIIRQTADTDGKEVKIYMEQEPGSSGVNTIDNYRRNILPDFYFKGQKVTGKKMDRAAPLSSQAEAGNVFIVPAEWNHDFLDEAELFPDGQFKDQVDAASGAFSIVAAKSMHFRVRSIG